MVQFLSIFFFLDFFNFCWVFQKFPFFCVTLYKTPTESKIVLNQLIMEGCKCRRSQCGMSKCVVLICMSENISVNIVATVPVSNNIRRSFMCRIKIFFSKYPDRF